MDAAEVAARHCAHTLGDDRELGRGVRALREGLADQGEVGESTGEDLDLLCEFADRVGDALRHAVEGAGHHGDLVLAADRELLPQLAAADRFGGGAQLAQRTYHAPGQEQGRQQSCNKRKRERQLRRRPHRGADRCEGAAGNGDRDGGHAVSLCIVQRAEVVGAVPDFWLPSGGREPIDTRGAVHRGGRQESVHVHACGCAGAPRDRLEDVVAELPRRNHCADPPSAVYFSRDRDRRDHPWSPEGRLEGIPTGARPEATGRRQDGGSRQQAAVRGEHVDLQQVAAHEDLPGGGRKGLPIAARERAHEVRRYGERRDLRRLLLGHTDHDVSGGGRDEAVLDGSKAGRRPQVVDGGEDSQGHQGADDQRQDELAPQAEWPHAHVPTHPPARAEWGAAERQDGPRSIAPGSGGRLIT